MAADPDALGEAAARAMLEVLRALRREVAASVLAAGPGYAAGYRALLADVDRLTAAFAAGAKAAVRGPLALAAASGDDAALADARRARLDVPLSYLGVSDQLVRTATDYVFTLLDGVTARVRERITREVRLAALGGQSFTALAERLAADLNATPKVFTEEARSVEFVARTEVSRLRNMAYADQAGQLADRYPWLRKRWLHSASAPGATTAQRRAARPNHVEAAAETAARPIPFAAAFDLGSGITARYPHDPLLPASETVGCRCRLMLVAPP